MNERRVTLNDVILFDSRGVSEEVLTGIERSESAREVRESIESLRSAGLGASVARAVLDKAAELLDVDLLDVMRWAWGKSRELRAYRDGSKYPPGRTFEAHLAEHAIRSVHKPHVEIRLNDRPVGRMDFSVDVEIILQGAKLKIRGGRIRKIHTGECRARGTFACEGFVLVTRELARLDLPGTLDLGEGVEI